MSQLRLDAINRVHDLLGRLAIPYWLFGGWAVDFHAGRVMREHSDIDMAIWLTDLDGATRALGQDGWEVMLISEEEGLLQLRTDSVRLDLAYLERDEATGAAYTPLPAGRGIWTDGPFGDELAELDGVHSRVVSLDSLVSDKSEDRTDPVSQSKDLADLAVLRPLR
jgi:Aminoglycoside-2''-adenylyltransferase